MVLIENVTLPKRSEMMVAAHVQGNLEEDAVTVMHRRNEYLGNNKKVLIAKALVVLSQQVLARLLLNHVRNGTSIVRYCSVISVDY